MTARSRNPLLVLVLTLAACGGGSPAPLEVGAESFVSQPPDAGRAMAAGGPTGGTPGGPAAPGTGTGADAAARTVEESDVYALSGSTLVALNAYRGLQLVDLADPARPVLRSRVPVVGQPVELYLRGGVALFVVRDTFGWAWTASADAVQPVAGSQLWAVDVSRADAPSVLARLDLEGSVVTTRLVGDVLHVVSRKSTWQDVLPAPGGLPVATTGAGGDLTYVASIDVADPRTPRAVARLDFPASGWDAHALVTDRRIVLAQSGWSAGGEVARFTFVDISDPGGALAPGASFEVPGRIADRWGLDQAGTVFRAVLQSGWNGGATLRTWTSATVGEATPLGRLDIVVPETLTAARFDGTRVYVVTAERIDPLWVVDAADPARPVLAGQLHMPGQLEFLEPRGDRLLALGHTNEAGQPWQLAVSLVDVADPALPTLRARVIVGEGPGNVGAVPDDLRKAFRVIDAAGLALVPYQGWDPASWRWAGGLQLVDFDLVAGTLAKRGFVPHPGSVSRAFPVPGRTAWLAALSDEQLQILDATDRAAPVERASLDLARPVNELTFVGGYAVELAGDWWRGDASLVVAPALDPDAATPLARVDLAAPQARLFRIGHVVWLLSHDFTQGKAWLEAVDLSDPLRPLRRGRIDVAPDEVAGASGWGFRGMGDEAVLLGPVLAVHRSWNGPGPLAGGTTGAVAPGGVPLAGEDAIVLFDLSNPDAPRRAGKVVLSASDWSWGLRADGGLLWLTHHEWTEDARGVRYYLDRVDVADPDAPRLLSKVNVPGTFLGVGGGGRVYTLDSRWDEATLSTTSTVHALDLTERGTARLVGSVSVPGWASGAILGAGQAWAVTQDWTGTRRWISAPCASRRRSASMPAGHGRSWPGRESSSSPPGRRRARRSWSSPSPPPGRPASSSRSPARDTPGASSSKAGSPTCREGHGAWG